MVKVVDTLPVWLPEKGRPDKEMVEKGVYAETTKAWLALTMQFVPRVAELVEGSGDELIAGSLAYRWAVCFDKFACGGDVRDSSEARQLLNELRDMNAADDNDAGVPSTVDDGLDQRMDEAMSGNW